MAHRTRGVGGPGPHASAGRAGGGGGGLRLCMWAEFGRAEWPPTLALCRLVGRARRMGAEWGRASEGRGASAGTARGAAHGTGGATIGGPLSLGCSTTAEPLADCVRTQSACRSVLLTLLAKAAGDLPISSFSDSGLEPAAAPGSSDRQSVLPHTMWMLPPWCGRRWQIS